MTNYYNSLCSSRDTAHKKTKFGVSGSSPNTTKTSRWWLASLFMVMSLFIGQFVSAQVAINETFDGTTTPTGWTYTSFSRSTVVPCAGAGAIRKNQWSSSTTGSATTPTWTSNGQNLTISFDYKLLNYNSVTPTVALPNSPAWGSIITEVSVNGGTSYTITAGTIDATNHVVSTTCANKSYTVLGSSIPSGSSTKVRFRLTFAGSTPDYFVYMDNVVLSQVSVTPPNCVTGLLPANSATDVAKNPTLSWTAATGAPTSYDVYFGNSSPAAFVTNVSAATLSYLPGILSASSTYYWKVVAKNANGDAVGCTEQSFTTGTNFNYCSSGLTTSGGTSDSVIGVTVGTYVSGAIGGASPWYTAVANTPIDIVAPSSQPISITMGTDGTQHSAVWIDFNQDGTFDASENVALSTVAAGASAVVSYTLAIPSTATLGVTRMRVRGAGDGAYTAAGACIGQSWGETEDYFVNLIAPPPSPPDCATALLPSDLSSDLPRNLTLTWTAAAGFPTSYDVYLSTASGSTTPVANVTGTSYTTAILDASTQYFWSVIAKNDNGEAVGCAEQSFTTGTSFNYCAAVPSSIDGNGITNVVLETLSNPNVSTTTYQNFTTGLPVPDLGTSLTIPMSVTYQTGFTYATRVFIDFNQDGDFNDTDENQLLGTSLATNPTTLSGTIAIPATALAGNTRMRVIGYDNDGNSACYSGSFSNVEDYTVNITITPPCSGAPAAAVASSSVSGACVGVAFTLTATGQTTGLGITYQWESADDVDFTTGVTALGTALSQPIASQTATKYYRFGTTCSTGPDTTYSNVVEVTQNAPTQCYCTPVTTSGCTDGDVIGRVVLNTLDNTSGVGCPSGTLGYSDYTSDPLLTTELQAGSTYACTVTAGEWAGSYAAWIDYNDDGVFDPVTERIGYTTTPVAGSGAGSGLLGSSASFPITLSCSPPTGVHRLRVREMFNIAGSAMTPCANNSFGEVEDYLITITAAVACPQPSALAAATVTSSGASLSWTAGCLETEWDVNIQAAGSGEPTSANNAGLTTTTLAASGLDADTAYEYYVRAVCATGSEYSLWTGPFTFTTLANAPGCTVVDSPADGATGVTVGTIPFSWTAPAVSPTEGAATSYDLYYGTSATPGVANTLIGNFTTTSASIILTGYNATFYLRVVPKNSGGSAVGPCTVTSFTTEADPFVPYCSSVTYTTDIEPISSVSFAGINNTSSNVVDGSPSIENFTAVSGNVTANSSYTMTIKGHTGGNFTTNLMVFADWNQDGDFADLGETYNAGSLTNSNGIDAVSAVSTIAVPVNALPGTTRLRIKKMFGTADNNPCVGAGYGQTEDYTLNVSGFTTDVAAASCGSTLANIYSSVYANIKSGATGYRFRVVGGTAGTQTIDRGIYHWFNLAQLPSYDYGTTYTVDVMLQVDGVWADYYGQSCTITTPGLISPTVGTAVVSSPTCGSELAKIYTSIYTTPKSGATGYRFRVVRAGGETQVLDRTQHFFNLTQLPIFVYGASYTVEVAFKTTGDYTPYGTACTLTSPAVPSIAECGLSRAAGSTISVPALPSVTNYAFEVTDLTNATTPVVINRSVQWMPVNLIPGYLATNEYSVRVALTSSGVQSDYGLDCSINPAAAVRYSNSSYASELKVQAFPNPFTNNFTLDITRASDENVSVMVYDMIGKLLDKVTVNATDNSLELGANYPAGVYNVIVSQGEKVETVRMVKR